MAGALTETVVAMSDATEMSDTTPPKVHPDAWKNLRKHLCVSLLKNEEIVKYNLFNAAEKGSLYVEDPCKVTLAPAPRDDEVQVVECVRIPFAFDWGESHVRMCEPQCWLIPTAPPRSPVGNGEPPAKMPKLV